MLTGASFDFMEKLVACSELQLCQNLRIKARPSCNFKKRSRNPLWINHVLKVRNNDLIKVEYLWRSVTCGAMVLCANGQRGVDLVITAVHSGNVFSRDNVQQY
jgi:hypothetical protein